MLLSTVYKTLAYQSVTLIPKMCLIKEEGLKKSLREVTDQKKFITLILLIGGSSLLIPIVEELLFRGLLETCLQWLTNDYIAALVSAVAFAGLHYTNDQNIAAVACNLFDSLFLYNPAKHSDGLLGSITAHAICNLTVFAAVLYKYSSEIAYINSQNRHKNQFPNTRFDFFKTEQCLKPEMKSLTVSHN